MATTLNYIGDQFVETNQGTVLASLELIPSGDAGTAKLSFSGETGLIARRTASRQAESICKSGFLMKSGERVGVGMTLEILEGDKLSDAHLREGHKYNRY